MRQVYLDNAATTFPKPPEVTQAMCSYIQEVGCNVNRGGYSSAYSAAETVLDTRERLCALFGYHEPRNVIFTANVTTSLNMILKGLLRPGDHVLVSSMEHNAVMRPLVQLQAQGVTFDRVPCNQHGELDLESMEGLFRPETAAVVMTHASNVCGTLLPVARVGELCRLHKVAFIVDCAQTGGVEEINMSAMGIDALAFTGHKGLLGPQGTGGFLVTEELAARMEPLLAGGTGSFSHIETMPELLPDRFEPGTPNLPGIYGLNAALAYLERTGIETIRAQERELAGMFLEMLGGDSRIRLLGVNDARRRTSVISLDFPGRDNAEIAFRLDSEYGIMTRCGLHCAPNAHKTLGTYPQGTVRFSPGHYTTTEELEYAVSALKKLLDN